MDGIVIQNVTHRYTDNGGKPLLVLQDVSFSILPGECVSLIGESGSGKSTIARLLLGFEKPSTGRIFLDGTDSTLWSTREWRKYRAQIQAVFQDASGTLHPTRSVYRNMEEGLINLTRLNKHERKKEILTLMELFHLEERILKTPVRQLSGGEQRRASLVRALALRPKYLVLDEVTSGLDSISADAVLSTLELYRERFGCTYLFITHDQSCAFRLSDRILSIQNGCLTKQGERIVPQHKNATV